MIETIIYSLISNLMFYSYGNFIKYEKTLNKTININERAIIGCILLSFIALLVNFFIPLSEAFNTFLLLVGIIFLIFKKKNWTKKETIFILFTSIVTSSLLIYSNVNRPDAGLYHLPYVSFLNENKIVFGLTNIHFRFGTISIMQYLSAINNNFFLKDIGVVIPLASIATFFIYYFFLSVLEIFKKYNNININHVFSLFIIIFISYKINRYSSFGNDAIAHLSFFYLVSKIIEKKDLNLPLIFLLAIFCFLNKTMMVVVLLIPLIFFLKKFQLKNFKLIFSMGGLLLILWIIKNIIISGCAVYPLKQSCIKNLHWIDIEEVKTQSISGEAWAKDWPNITNKDVTMENYIKKFRWFQTWKNNHGIKFLKITIPYFILIILLSILISRKNHSDEIFIKERSSLKILLIISFLGLLLFFIKFPLFRYGYSYLITFFTLFLIFLTKTYNYNKLIKYSKIIFIICIVVIFGKQTQRYIKNFQSGYLLPRIYSYDKNKIPKLNKIKLGDNFHVYKTNGDLCMYSNSPCTNYSLKDNIYVVNKLNYTFINLNKDK